MDMWKNFAKILEATLTPSLQNGIQKKATNGYEFISQDVSEQMEQFILPSYVDHVSSIKFTSNIYPAYLKHQQSTKKISFFCNIQND